VELVSTTGVEPCFLLDEALLEHFFVGEPQIGDVGGAKPQNVLEGAVDFAEPEIDTDALEQLDERLRAFGQDWARLRVAPQRRSVVFALKPAIQTMIGHYVNGLRTAAVPYDV